MSFCRLTETLAQSPANGSAALKNFTFQELFGPGQSLGARGTLPSISRWRADGEHYLQPATDPQTQDFQLLSVRARTGASEVLFGKVAINRALKAAGAASPEASGSLSGAASRLDVTETRLLVTTDRDLWLYDRTTDKAVRLTNTPDAPESEMSFSPDGRFIGFVRGNNLFVVPADARTKERALTSDGGPLLFNGTLDWIYEEEIYGRGNSNGYAWSPDSRQIAFLRTDDSPIKPFAILDPVPRQQALQEQRYPLPGDPNPVVTLGIADVANPKAPTRFVDTAAYPDQDRLIVRFGWTPGNNVLLEVQNRIQTRLDLLVADRNSGKTTRLFQETTPAWVDPIGLPIWLKDGTFLWQSERTGWRHLYHYKPDGTLIGAVTSGEWAIRDFYGVAQPETGTTQVYFSAATRASTGNDLFRAALDGKTAPERLTESVGSHQIRLNPSFTLYLDTASDLWNPPQLRLYAVRDNNRELRTIADSAALVTKLKGYAISRPELMTVKARDGFPLEAVLIKPTNFDPAKRYPVYQEVYGGPGISTVRNAWGGSRGLFYQSLAQKGYIVWLCDNRSASGKGAKSQWTIYKNPGEGELRDVEDGLTWLKKQPWVDGDRVALYGWSYGGFLVQYALTHSKSFKLGIAGAGVSDWGLYDTVYTERYLDTPAANPDGYKKSAPVTSAANLGGKLLLLHGLADDNVHLQNTLQMVYALEQAEKQYELALYPRSRHGIGEPTLARHLQQRILDFLTANL